MNHEPHTIDQRPLHNQSNASDKSAVFLRLRHLNLDATLQALAKPLRLCTPLIVALFRRDACVGTHVRSRSDRRRGAQMLFIPAIRYHRSRSPHFRRMPAWATATLSDDLSFHLGGNAPERALPNGAHGTNRC